MMANSLDGNGSTNYKFKVVLLGEGSVGKTSIVLRYVEDKFNADHITTLQASCLNKKLNISGKRVNLSIWDTAGQEKFHALGPIYYRMSNGAILVYDITNKESFVKVKNWVKELRKMLGSTVCLTIAGNKFDREEERLVANEVAEEYAVSVGAKHFLTSAKFNENIENLFLELTQRMIEKHELENKETAEDRLMQTGSMKRNVIVVDDEQTDQCPHRQGCCGGGGGSGS